MVVLFIYGQRPFLAIDHRLRCMKIPFDGKEDHKEAPSTPSGLEAEVTFSKTEKAIMPS